MVLMTFCLKLVNREGVNMANKVKCFWGFQICIKSVLLLFEDLKSEGFEYLYTRRLNQDALEHFFGFIQQQGGYCTNPSNTILRAFKKCIGMTLFTNSDAANCETESSRKF